MPLTSLGSSSSLQPATQDLLDLEANLSEHVLDSLTKAHAVNVIQNNYYDSGGDLYGNYALRLVVQGNVVYVPAQIPNPDPGPSAVPSFPTIQSLTGVLVGSPAPGYLISPLPPVYTSQVTALLALLIYHARKNHDVAHNGMTLLAGDPVLDNAGHVVARNRLSISINGQTYYIPCDPNPSGPPGPVQFGLPAYWGSPVYGAPGVIGGVSFNSNSTGAWGAYATMYQQVIGGFTAGETVTWQLQVSPDSQTWVNLSLLQQFLGANPIGGQPITRALTATSGTPIGPGTVSVLLQFYDTNGAGNNRGTANFLFRLAFTSQPLNTVTYSRVVNALIGNY